MAEPTTSTTAVTNTTTTTTAAINTAPMIAASAIALPAFWPSKTELWFAMVEAKFGLAHPRITQEQTKFNHVLTVLSPEIADEVADLITKPDANEPYSKLKEAIINRTTLSDSQRLKQLLSGEELGTRKPSQLLRHMRQLVNDTGYVNDQVLKELFLQQMPVNVKQILLSLTSVTLDQLAEIADRILESTPVVAAVSHSGLQKPQPHKQNTEVNDPMVALTSKLDAVMQRLDFLENRDRRHQHNSRSRNRSRSKTPGPPKYKVCWYHFKFGEKAEKCTTPCSYSTSKNGEAKQ